MCNRHKYYDFYFDHSYAVTNTNEKFTSIGKCFHNENIICYIEKKNIIACQFHPEFLSRPNRPQPIFKAFVEASLKHQQK